MGMQLILLLIRTCLAFCLLSVCGDAAIIASSPWRLPQKPPIASLIRPSGAPSLPPDHALSPTAHRFGHKHHKVAPFNRIPARVSHDAASSPSVSLVPSMPPSRYQAKKWVHGPASSPSVVSHRHHHLRHKFRSSAPEPTHSVSPSAHTQQVSPFRAPSPSPAPASSPFSSHHNVPIPSPAISPLSSSMINKNQPPSAVMTLPPPPPNEDCISVTCTDPLTYTPPGTPCSCVWPVQVQIRLSISIYKFFPLVSKLADEIADSVSLNHTQVRIMGADAATQQLEKTTVLINLVPKGYKFNDTTSFSIYQKFWNRKIFIYTSLFGAYEVLYVHYPGLPPSPPSASSIGSIIDNGPNPGSFNTGSAIKPLGVDVPRKRKEGSISRPMIAVIILSSFAAFVICIGVAWLLLLKCRAFTYQHSQTPHTLSASPTKPPPGHVRSLTVENERGSASMSFSSGALTYTGSAKSFSLKEMELATNNFDSSRIIGEGGFGLVYRGILDDGREVAVKVLKRVNHHGTREFLAEVEMLSRLHHRNLVKLFGICTEDHTRCLIYELVPNGSVESHLHGTDKETDPLDWEARMKIALGSARGLAYLHEDSNPRVIHRDFKSSNILLEHDFTPKVSDFGLARTALEDDKHISTHVMGTFGYLAPEYAMTGHLLVKSDVYSYGVVLLELVTGRKPVDLSFPPGQENLVAWARPLLSSKEGLDALVDPNIKHDISFDNLGKVAAIASMCVQPEVSHRPFMGEVVQALKLVCNEFDEEKQLDGGSISCSQQDEFLTSGDSKFRAIPGEVVDVPEHSGVSHETEIRLPASGLISAPMGIEGDEFESFRWQSTSEPLRTGRRKHFWQRLGSLSRGSMSEHGFSSKFWP